MILINRNNYNYLKDNAIENYIIKKMKEEIIILVYILMMLLEIVKKDGIETPRKASIGLITNDLY